MSSPHKNKNFLNIAGVFAVSSLVAASAIYVYSPVIGTHASDSLNVSVGATINPVASLTLDTNNISFSFTPTSAGVFESKAVNATVDTNSTGGYELYFSSEDNETAMTNALPGVESVIASDFSGTVTSSTMASNKWGYSLNNTDFSKIPTQSAQTTIKNIDHFPAAAEKTTTVNIGMKVDTNLPSGTYSKNVVFSVIAHDNPTPFPASLTTMQGMTPEIANSISVGMGATLTDTRDGNTYTVKKLADGKIWMTQNLRIANKTITSADSNLPEGETFTIPASDIASFDRSYNTAAVYVDETYGFGGYYAFYTATAGWGTNSAELSEKYSPQDICPKGWRLPTGGYDGGEFKNLYSHYNSSALMRGEPGFVLSGSAFGGMVVNRNATSGTYWSSFTLGSQGNAYTLYLSEDGVYPSSSSGQTNGYSVRCIAK